MNQTADETSRELAAALPPRYRWLKRLAVGLGLFFAFVIVLRMWWGHEAHRRLQAEIDRIQAAGEPIFPEDFDPAEEIPDDENAAWALRQASKKLTTSAELSEIMGIDRTSSALTLQQWQEIAGSAKVNTESLTLVRAARGMSKSDWGIGIRSPATNAAIPYLGPLRQLARLTQHTAAWHHRWDNDYEAVELIRDILSLAQAAEGTPTLLSHLVAAACALRGVSAIESSAHSLVVGEIPAANRKQVEALIATLLDEGAFLDGQRRAMHGERAFQLDAIQRVAEGDMSLIMVPRTATSDLIGVAFNPLVVLDGARMLQHFNHVIEACESPSWPEANEVIEPLERAVAQHQLGLRFLKRPVSTILMPSLDGSVRWHYRTLAERRMAAIALAMRLYELDHRRRPRQLSELVPDYLLAMPLDPLADDGRVIAYLPEAEPMILYSVGDNGIDDHGTFEFDSKGHIDARKADLLFFLDGVRPQQDNP